MKRIGLLLSCLLLASCGAKGSSSALPSSQAEESLASSQISVVSSSEAESSEATTSEAESSSEAEVSSIIEEASSISESKVTPGGCVYLSPEAFPSMPSNGYPGEQTITSGEYQFDIGDVGQSTWKEDKTLKTIQMRKQTSYINSKQLMPGGCFQVVSFHNSFFNYEKNEEVLATLPLTVEVSATIDGERTTLEPSASQEGDLWTFSYLHLDSAYYWLSNQSSYAQYVSDIRWVW